jgi:predicted porin
MKKTIIASAIAAAVAAPAAFADVKISGNVIQEFVADDDGTHNSDGAAKTTIDDGLESKAAVDLVFSVSEDLGNGLTAFAKIHTLRDNGGSGNADQVVGLKGDFGTIVAGRMEDFSEGKVAGMASVDSSDALSIEPNGAFDTGRAEGGIAYVSPSFNGLTFGIAGYALPNGGASDTVDTISISGLTTDASGVSSTSATLQGTGDIDVTYLSTGTNLDADAKIDATDIMVEYANGPLLVRVARESIDKKATKAGASGQDQETDSIAVSYKMDNITLVGYAFDVENGAGTANNDADGYMVGAKIAMGANTFGIGYSEETDVDSNSATGAYTVDSTNGGDNESWIVSVDHALSKRTSVTAAYMDVDDVDANADKSVYAIGLKHVF